jgi:hypothetical protein
MSTRKLNDSDSELHNDIDRSKSRSNSSSNRPKPRSKKPELEFERPRQSQTSQRPRFQSQSQSQLQPRCRVREPESNQCSISSPDSIESATNSSEDSDKISPADREILKKAVTAWILYDDKIRSINKDAKKYKQLKKTSEEEVIQMLTKVENEKVHVANGETVHKTISRTKAPLKPEIIKKSLMELFQDETKADEVLQKIMDKRAINERVYLKRTRPHGDKK